MNKYLKYLKYVLRHKWYVLKECFSRGMFLKGITHDMSKFLPSEFIPYARYFSGEYKKREEINSELYCKYNIKSLEEVEDEMNVAWLKHIHRNKHHWQHWVLREDSGNTIVLDMPSACILEMLADWVGAGKAIHGIDNTKVWYLNNKNKMVFSGKTRETLEHLIITRYGN